MSTPNLDSATKLELRALAKSAGIRGYGNMTNDQMRAALRAHAAKAPARLTNGVPVKVVAQNLDSDPGRPDARVDKVAGDANKPVAVTDDGDKPIRPASKSKKQKAARRKKSASESTDKPSVKEWLRAQIEKHGEVKVDAAKKYVTDSGRSLTTLYRQCGELELTLDREAGVWRAK